MPPKYQRVKTDRASTPPKVIDQPKDISSVSATQNLPQMDIPTTSVDRSTSLQSTSNPVCYSDVVKAIKETMTPLLQEQANTFTQMMQEMKDQITNLQHRVEHSEQVAGDTFQEIEKLKPQVLSLQKSHHQMWNKIDDLENRSRRNNLRIIGLPENLKGPDLLNFLKLTLPNLLKITEECKDLVIERAHRLGPQRDDIYNRPRAVIFRSLSFLHKDIIWMASKKIENLTWEGNKLRIFQDYSAEVTKARKEFSTICTNLIKQQRKFALLYPARLRLFNGRDYKDFMNADDAKAFLQEEQADSSVPPRSPYHLNITER